VRLGAQTLPFGPIGSPESAEWGMEPARLQELEALVASTGGEDRNDLAAIWQAPRTNRSAVDLRPLALLAALGLFLAEALRARLRPATAMVKPAKSAAAETPVDERPVAPGPGTSPDAERRRRRYGDAKRGG
jgi:hypothetical protein